VLPLFLPLAVAVVAGDAVAGEASAGTLRYLLVLPVHRGRLLAVKYAGVVAFSLVATLLVSAVGVAVGWALFPSGAVTLLSGTQVSTGAAIGRVLLVSLYLAGCMAALAAIGLFVSTLVEASVAAIATTVGVAIASQIVDAVPQVDVVHPYLFSHWWLSFGDLLRTPIVTGDVVQGIGVSVAYVAIFGSLAWARFAGKDVAS
jgi:ABC-2 type transport system permease protein